MGKVKIVGGVYRSRVLSFQDNIVGMRPTTSHARGVLFNWLYQDLTGKVCLDLFAGSGVLAVEALSRNAKFVVMIDNNRRVICDIEANLKLLKINNVQVLCQSALTYIDHAILKFDIVFLDPPFSSDLLSESLSRLFKSNLLHKDSILYIEYCRPPDIDGYTVLKCKKVGTTSIALLQKLY